MRAVVLAGGFVVLWSSGFVGASLASSVSPASGTLAWRYLVTAVLLLAVVTLRHGRRSRRISLRAMAQQAVLGLLAHVVFLGGVFGAASAHVDAGTTALVCALQPMLVAAGGRLFWADRVTGRQLAGLGLGLVAVVLTAGGADTSASAAVLLPTGSVVGLSAAALLERRWQPATDVTASLAIQVTVSAGVFTAYAVVTGTLRQVTPSAQFLAALAWLVALSGLGGYATFILCLRRFGASFTSTLLYLTPPVTTLWAWAMFDDTPTLQQLGGLTLGALAVWLAIRRSSGKPSGTAS